MAKISIIVPVYNAEKYLKHAIDCLINQTLKDIEIILIDDGSTDNSPKICDDIAYSDKRIIVKHIKNNGLCNARNLGIQISSSKYIMFMDNDDEFDINVCKDNYEIMQKKELDMVKFGRKEIISCEGKIQKESIRSFNERILDEKDLKKEKMNLFYDEVFDCVWDGIYKKSILPNFDTSLKMGGEDYLFGLEIYEKLNKIMLRDEIYYYHFVRRGISTSTKYNSKLVKDEKKIYKKYKETLEKDENTDPNKYNIRLVKNFVGTIVMNFSKNECQLTNKEIKRELKELNFKLKKNSNIFTLLKLSPKYTLVFLLYKFRLYSILLFIYKISENIKINSNRGKKR